MIKLAFLNSFRLLKTKTGNKTKIFFVKVYYHIYQLAGTMVLDSPLPQFGPIWRKKSLSGRHFFLVRATMNIKPVLKSSWTKLKHRRCTKRPGELKHINILVLKKSILKKTKKT